MLFSMRYLCCHSKQILPRESTLPFTLRWSNNPNGHINQVDYDNYVLSRFLTIKVIVLT